MHAISRQAILFNENLEELLSPIISSDAEMNTLLRDPTDLFWGRAELEEKPRNRLPRHEGDDGDAAEIFGHTESQFGVDKWREPDQVGV